MGSVAVAHSLNCSRAHGILLTRDLALVPCIGRQILNHLTTWEAIISFFIYFETSFSSFIPSFSIPHLLSLLSSFYPPCFLKHYTLVCLSQIPSLAILEEKIIHMYQRVLPRATAVCQVSLRVPITSKICWADSQESAKMLYSWLKFIIPKGYSVKSAKGKGRGEPRHSPPYVPSQWSCMGTGFLHPTVMFLASGIQTPTPQSKSRSSSHITWLAQTIWLNC